ncbi:MULTISPECIES: SDR family oxidoreductase [Streptomyces]|uniref:SDR family oxidoreductase n=1 Tax=Streptomyces TaxID=1883 RepID=UPI00163B6CEF|nr:MULTISPECIES: NAD(P)-binding oxidoreductase [Streptomyces]MBC2875720.1 NAD(P)H-binding protein [Streptomyces sp. TYQ1024]UBI37574.1 SDR family oxidoreductase [Streptomyces mobaraensis]UKW30162.1 SDR family oxidoreductase [Streptomyces sp. TYQ1024]
MTSPILVTGGTGTLGGHVLPLLRQAGRDVRVLSRHAREAADGVEYVACDLLAQDGGRALAAALEDVEIVLHLAGGPKGDDVATRALVRAAAEAGVRHFVYISVIGADRVPLGYFRSKLGAERAVAESGLPWTTLRAAQFHDLVLKVVRTMAKMPVVPVPGGIRMQPVDAREVAERLVELALGEPAGLVPDLAGPTVYGMGELARGYLRAHGKRRPMLPVRLPGKVGRAYRAAENLSLEDVSFGTRTWEEFLDAHTGNAHAGK